MELGSEKRGLRKLLMVVGVIVLLCGVYYAHWQHQYQRAESAAAVFCASAAPGSDIISALPRLDSYERVRHGFRDNETRYVAMFPGPIFNAFICEIELKDRKVVSTRVIAMED